jgi:uncharacterized membrane protein
MRFNKWLIALIVLSVIGTALLYPALPPVVPQHWNIDGQPDRFGPKSSVLITALLPLAIYLLMGLLPKIDPRRESYQKHRRAYQVTSIASVSFIIIIHWITLLAIQGFPIDIGITVRILLGLLLILLGNYCSQIRSNYFFGIRTPWALADETIWRKTNRFGGYGLVIAGLCALLSVFLPNKAAYLIFLGSLFGVILAIPIYSYWEYRKRKKANRFGSP